MKNSSNVKFKPLSVPAFYFPLERGRYDVKPNLHKLGYDFGHAELDRNVLQIDNQFAAYRQQKLDSRNENLHQYYCEELLNQGGTRQQLVRFLAENLCTEYPEYFQKKTSKNGWRLQCALSNESLVFDSNDNFIFAESNCAEIEPTYVDGVDALACQIQEDICVLTVRDSQDFLSLSHLCFPNRWNVTSKIGKSFAMIHTPVAGFAKANPKPDALVRTMMSNNFYVRFAWGLSNDQLLNHHPSKVKAIDFNHGQDPLYLRVERQVICGLPNHNLILFFIRTYYYDCKSIRTDPAQNRKLRDALLAMDADTVAYKALDRVRDSIVNWLNSTNSD